MNGYEKENWMCVPQELLDALSNASSFLIMAHQKPDGDAIGSMIALGKGLKQTGKTVHYAADGSIEEKLCCFEEVQYFNQDIQNHYDAAVFVDCSTYDYAVRPENDWEADQLIVIDHHKSNIGYGNINFIEETAAASELIYRILTALSVSIDDEMADALYAGISTDTGQFQYSNVTWQTHEIISRLYQIKSDYTDLSKRMHSVKSVEQFKMFGAACDSLKLTENGKLAWIYLPIHVIEAYGGAVNITDDIASLGVNVKGTVLAVTVKEIETGHFRVSLRSVDPWPVDVSCFAKKYGGGGHRQAAGFSWHQSLELLETEIVSFLKGCLS